MSTDSDVGHTPPFLSGPVLHNPVLHNPVLHSAHLPAGVTAGVPARLAPSLAPGFPTEFPVGRTLYRTLCKRLLDLAVIAMISVPVLLVVGLLALIVASRGGKPFYRQTRVGRGGRPYTMWKLRSMVKDADTKLDAYLQDNPAARAEWNSDQKLRCDPRITRFGHFLRKYSLDELPQLWNVLRGDMSLVGPRPMMPEQQSLYPGTAYYRLRPGITGPWQVSARNATTFADRAQFDAAYDQSLSLGTDLRLLLATVRVVLRGTGC